MNFDIHQPRKSTDDFKPFSTDVHNQYIIISSVWRQHLKQNAYFCDKSYY